jgi:hypothetical protein
MHATEILRGAAIVAIGLALTGCGDEQTCQALSAPPAVYVIDDATLEPICDGKVEIEDGDFGETITYSGGSTGLYLLPARLGTYTTFVSTGSGDYAITATQITVRKDDCGAIGPENAGPQGNVPGQPNAVTVTLRKL